MRAGHQKEQSFGQPLEAGSFQPHPILQRGGLPQQRGSRPGQGASPGGLPRSSEPPSGSEGSGLAQVEVPGGGGEEVIARATARWRAVGDRQVPGRATSPRAPSPSTDAVLGTDLHFTTSHIF